MQNLWILIALSLILSCKPSMTSDPDPSKTNVAPERPEYVVVIHGGAGTIRKDRMTEELEEKIRTALDAALLKGESVLKAGGSAMDAVSETIMILENSPYFNAGKGAVFTNAGTNELDASIMHGETLNAGAVGGVKTVKNPILAARAVLENSPHVMLSGEGADLFAKEQGLELVDQKYFYTEQRWKALQNILQKENVTTGDLLESPRADYKYGTVGCAVLDKDGNLVAGTSTGGMTNKRWGRIGDSPIIGAGTYANNKTCALSSTGHGEFFIRHAVAYNISARMEHGGADFQSAADAVINEELVKAGGSGGVIGVDHLGNVAMPFNTAGMYRGYLKSTGEKYIGMYKE
ncbi:MAG: isoaspartyl peptidase/L-asparaginase [Saprospiraceae bacterium]|nr:isoaspartyl peptidase/L-asparaginase [Saprospiraceae bacterium]